MLKFNLARVLALRGIDKPYKFLTRIGFYRTVASNLFNNRAVNIKIPHLEALCRALNCTPNDLFEWKPDANDTLGENHPLNSLKHEQSAEQLLKIFKQIPVDKFDRMEELLNQLKNE